ncbi:FAD binding domain-containing protein [Aspergillus heteromorphus CBS 117.55]|uniref:FAD binding domain-containing protein n=1 Tax=Aspergillus heteromorphus CBS 117.55 TaxID=1448321 RepID=A0A317W9P7_9EURO|nr:FAD binding domain-containing protein [Aspergillus heteromorphus CBS 117.55]PWY82037.1 FAD binding domain-containing protein [Aspergillus heteromorphus CBS 117.55]
MSAHVFSQLPALQATVASDCRILQDPEDSAFQERLRRWTNIGRQTPTAIILPRTEEDCLETVRWALQHSIPLVPSSGGHSAWSTIGEGGVIIDLSNYVDIRVDEEAKTATLVGGVLSKEVGLRLAEAGLFTALGNGNTVGAIPYFLGGGASITTSITGFGSDQIVSARVITARNGGELVEVTATEHPDLLWALRGAGQFFGLVTQLTIRAHPVSLLRKQQGLIWVGAFIFPLARTAEVTRVMKTLMADTQHATAGLMMIMAPPPTRTPSLVISARYTGDEDPHVPFGPLYDLQPVVATGNEVPVQNASDAREILCAKGDFKQFGVVGLHGFDADAFVRTVDIWTKMVTECPDAINTAFNFQWDARPPRAPEADSASSLHDIRYWQNNLIWHTDSANRDKVDRYNEACISVMRGPDEMRFVDFQNGTRTGPIERRYRGTARLAKLRRLKREWDPQGVFTTQLLD